jgi:glutathione peroxidase
MARRSAACGSPLATSESGEIQMAKILFLMVAVLMIGAGVRAADKETQKAPPALRFTMHALDGKAVDLARYHGKVVLIVNVASECGLTPQYEQLQALHNKYKDQGLAVIGFPCNQFGMQEPGSAAEIQQFCTRNYGVTFDLFAKVDVNGEQACPLYKHLQSLPTKPKGAGAISWNFEKFLLSRKGDVVARFAPATKPDAPDVVARIEAELGGK